MAFDFGDVLGFAGKLTGGLLDYNAQRDANNKNQENALRQEQLQREFAQTGIRWKVADAEAAGIHPLYALGASTASYSPVSVGAQPASLGSMASDMGQDLSRAVNATRTAPERASAISKTADALTLKNMELKNELLASQIAKLRASANPPMPGKVADPDKMDPPPAPEHSGLRAGIDTTHNPRFSDAQKYEDRYGDVGENVAGVMNAGADLYAGLRETPYIKALVDYIRGVGRYNNGSSPSRQIRRRWPQ